ncbi:tRNA(Ile)-lysidine synthase [Jezberella montanilacus]|uniref:tRNA(Ile)-lysidine synthase n=1 Tax=Jezberella montanilacus TaxID=323426 RepID=A0A2T0XKJ6_9BURK|nr:tRNA lysidine(34) synthetase TilS [Jezberella montanilacus]PRY99478.1 tRNA(Ile)-lysidine synthase [Jezberella montanilacus]
MSASPEFVHRAIATAQADELAVAVRQAFSVLPPASSVAVALSGGADSLALAAVATAVANTCDVTVKIFHIHHGLYAEADNWVQAVKKIADDLGVFLVIQHVQVDQNLGLGIEGAARDARYTAFAEMAKEHGVDAILLGHHQQDQAETVLLRLLRGTGVQGLAAMKPDHIRNGLRLLRPWLDIDRAVVLRLAQALAAEVGWQAVQDPSNRDERYARGALREKVIPALLSRWPSWVDAVTRHARQAAEATQILNEVAEDDLSKLDIDSADKSFSLSSWRDLSPTRQKLVMRFWLQKQAVQMPSERRLGELIKQLRQLHALGHDRSLQWQHGPIKVSCVRGRVILVSS